MTKRIAIVGGVRTPFCKANGVFRSLQADDLGAYAVKELIARTGIDPNSVDEFIFGNVLQPSHATNIARVIAIKGGLPDKVPAMTVNRNCASGMEAIVYAFEKISMNEGGIYIVGGVESMSNTPILFGSEMRDFLLKMSKAKTLKQKLFTAFQFRPRFLTPNLPKIEDPLCGLNMGQTAEILTRDFLITRKEQDTFAFKSQERAAKAKQSGRFKEEIVPIPTAPKYDTIQEFDDGIRDNQSIEDLEKLRPVFDPLTGSVTAGTSSQVTDGAVALLLMSEEKAKKLGLKPLGYVTNFAVAGLQPQRMGLGPAYATSKLLEKTGLKLEDFDLIEINEAFAAQVIAVKKALASDEWCKRELGRDKAVGNINPEILNVNGGALALGHPLGASGARLVLTLLIELRDRNKNRGLAALCIGGGQGEAIAVEVK
jgi:acetyl-CoA acetyltransferase family protein